MLLMVVTRTAAAAATTPVTETVFLQLQPEIICARNWHAIYVNWVAAHLRK